MVEGLAALLHDALDLLALYLHIQAIEAHGFIDSPAQSRGVVVFENKSVTAVLIDFQVRDRIMESAGIVCNRQRTVDRCDHLRQAAGFKAGRHQNKVGSTVSLMFEVFVKITNSHPAVKIMIRYDISKNTLIVAVGHKNNLQAVFPVVSNDLVENRGQ